MLSQLHVLPIMLLLQSTTVAPTSSARRYYQELRDVNGLNPLTTLVCFSDSVPEVFATIGFAKQMTATAKAKGLKLEPEVQKRFDSGDDCMVSISYNKGVSTQNVALCRDKADPDRNHWLTEFDLEGVPMRLEFSLSPAGRFRRAMYAIRAGKEPALLTDHFGLCEPMQ